MNRTFAFLCLLMISCKGERKPDAPKQTATISADCDSQRHLAISDFNSGTAKYYFFGLAYPSKEIVDKLNAAHVQVVVKDCQPEKQALCYNQFVDSLLQAKNMETKVNKRPGEV